MNVDPVFIPLGEGFCKVLNENGPSPHWDTIARNFIAICLECKVLQTVPSVFGD